MSSHVKDNTAWISQTIEGLMGKCLDNHTRISKEKNPVEMKLHDPNVNKVLFEVTVKYPGKYLGYYRGGRAKPPNENKSARNYGRCNQLKPTLQKKDKCGG